jgi:hypothetical protein
VQTARMSSRRARHGGGSKNESRVLGW